ncbi:hypothetical protein NECID01_0710 [Nematocida sp. AWRm77]|nr:hypothetical protein NECID01_0710 [Nematocida sp. AWRm77]
MKLAKVFILGTACAVSAATEVFFCIDKSMDEKKFLSIANTCITHINDAIRLNSEIETGQAMGASLISKAEAVHKNLVGTMSVLESLNMFIKDSTRKELYMEMLVSGDFSGLQEHLFYIYTGFLSTLEYNCEVPNGALVPSFKILDQYTKLRNRCNNLYKYLALYEAKKKASNKEYMLKVTSVWELTEILKEGLLTTETHSTVEKQVYDIYDCEFSSSPFSYDYTDEFSSCGAEVIEEEELSLYKPFEDIQGQLYTGADSYNTFFAWMKHALETKSVDTIPWVYFDKNVFLNVPFSVDRIVLESLVPLYTVSSITLGLNQTCNLVQVSEETKLLEGVFSLYEECMSTMGPEGTRVLQRILKSHVYDILMAYLSRSLDKTLFTLELRKAHGSFLKIKEALKKASMASMQIHYVKGMPSTYMPAQRTNYGKLIRQCLSYAPTLVWPLMYLRK